MGLLYQLSSTPLFSANTGCHNETYDKYEPEYVLTTNLKSKPEYICLMPKTELTKIVVSNTEKIGISENEPCCRRLQEILVPTQPPCCDIVY
jgi:hypothetical protein